MAGRNSNNRRTGSVVREIQLETRLNLIATMLSSVILFLLTDYLKAILNSALMQVNR